MPGSAITRNDLPPLDAALMWLILAAEMDRDERGWEWCLKSGIGRLRRKHLGFGPRTDSGNPAVEEHRTKLRDALTLECAGCQFTECPLHG